MVFRAKAICSECEANRKPGEKRPVVKLKFSYRVSARSTMALDRAEGFASPARSSAAILTVNEVVRKLRDDSQSVLVRASDGLLYWVKLMSGFDGPNALANQVLETNWQDISESPSQTGVQSSFQGTFSTQTRSAGQNQAPAFPSHRPACILAREHWDRT